jgi:hypothetical protein
MGEDHGGMYSGWDKEGNYTDEWMDKTTTFLDRAFSLSKIVWCPCRRCQNLRCLDCWTRQPLWYTYVRIASCQAMRCENFTVSQVL